MRFFLFAILLSGCATTYEKEILSQYQLQQWKSANYSGMMDTNYDRGDAFIEPANIDNPPPWWYSVSLPYDSKVVHSYPGRYFFLKKGETWYKFRFNDELDDIEELEKTNYTQMYSWGNNNMIVGGFRPDGTLDIITTYTGVLVVNLKDVDREQPVSQAYNAAFVRLKDGTFRHILAHKKKAINGNGDWYLYTTHFSLSPHIYLFAGEIQNISLGIRELGGDAYTELFYQGAVVDLSKNREHAKTTLNEKYMQEHKTLEFLDFGEEPERRFMILRDGELTPPQYKELDSEKLRSLVWMKAETGAPRALGFVIPNEKGEPRIHSLGFNDYKGNQKRDYRSGTFQRSLSGVKDAIGSFYVNTYNYQEHPVIIFQGENNLWNWGAGDLDREKRANGISLAGVEKEGLNSLQETQSLIRKKCGTFNKTPEEVAQARQAAKIRSYNLSMGAQEQYELELKRYEYRKKLAAYEAEQAQRREFQEAMGSISSSLTQGATSNTPKGPRGFEDRDSSTGYGGARYQKHVEKEAKRKARPGQN